jgi:hypothetical protein
MIAVEPFDVAHLANMTVQPAQIEARMSPLELMQRGMALSATGDCFTARRRADGKVLMCGGALTSHPGLATLWAVFALAAIEDRRAMTAIRHRVRHFLTMLQHRRIDTLVRSDHRAAHRFALRLGFKAEARLNDYFEDGSDAVVYRYRGHA